MIEQKKIVTAICQECGKQFEYELNPKYPRKYCFECSATKKASFEAQGDMQVPVVKPGIPEKTQPQAPVKEFHLSPEQVNTNALDLALKCKVSSFELNKHEFGVDDLVQLAKEFKEFIENGC